MFEYFYNEIFRKTIISFGTLFNDISIKHTDSDGNKSTSKVPLAYGKAYWKVFSKIRAVTKFK